MLKVDTQNQLAIFILVLVPSLTYFSCASLASFQYFAQCPSPLFNLFKVRLLRTAASFYQVWRSTLVSLLMFQSAGSASRCLSLARAVDSPPTTYGHEITIMGFVSRDLHTYLVHAKWFIGIFGSAMPNRTSWPLTSLYQVPTKPVAGYHYRHSLVFKYYLLLVVLFGVLCILPVFLLGTDRSQPA